MSFNKNGIITANNIYESYGYNMVKSDHIGKSFTYTPTTGTNSCAGSFVVDVSNYVPGEKLYVRIKFQWSGMDTSNTNGTFAIRFQGSTYSVADNAWDWTVGNNVGTALTNNGGNSITQLISSKSSGCEIIEVTCTLNSLFPSERSMLQVGMRSDYSNGTGTVTFSDLLVIPERYFVSDPGSSIESPVMRIGKEHLVTNQLYEI